MFRAVIFDVDGTLVDSVDLHAAAWAETLRHFGKDPPFAEVREQIGKGADQLLPVFFTGVEVERLGASIGAFRTELFGRRYLPGVRAFPKSTELLVRLQNDGVRVALASSAPPAELQVYKRLMQLEYLDVLDVSADDVVRSKPYPDIFVAALERLGNPPPNQVTVVGDSPHDAEAARQAHLQTVGVLCGGFPEDVLRAAGCVATYADPADLLHRYNDWVRRARPYQRAGVPIEPSLALEAQRDR